jgi:hypothetical protein
VEQKAGESSPGGASANSSALQRREKGKVEQVLEGRLMFSRTLFSAAMTGLLSLEALAAEVKQ